MTRLVRRRALLIGNEIYGHADYPPLPSVRRDLELMAEALSDRRIGGFDVDSLIDLTLDQMRERLDAFLGDSREDELTLLYFSGHGDRSIADTGEFHFIATDSDPSRLAATAMRATYVNDLLEACLAPQKIVIIDSCRSGGFAVGLRTADTPPAPANARPSAKGGATPGDARPSAALAARGVYVVSSSRAGELSFAGRDSDEPSVFTNVLVNALCTGEAARGRREVSVKDLFEYVNEKLRRNDAGQVPVISASGVDARMILALSPLSPITLAHNVEPVAGVDLPDKSAKDGVPRWDQLISYYRHCLDSEGESWLSVDDADDTYVCLQGRERLLVGAVDSDHAIEIPPESKDFVARMTESREQLWAGYPAVVVTNRLRRDRRDNRPLFAPLLIRRVEVVQSGGESRLAPVGTPIVHPSILQAFMKPDEIAAFVQDYQPTWHAGEYERMASELRQLLRNEFEITSVEDPEPDLLATTIDVDTSIDGARNAAVLFRMQSVESGPNKQLLTDLAEIAVKAPQIASTALAALAPDPAVRPRADGGASTVVLVTPLECNESQEAVIRSAMVNPLTVATGPPGTGKSQLVANLVATAVANGQTVLVASTNNRAVDEVWERCEKLLPGTVIRTGNREARTKTQAGLASLTRLELPSTNVQTALLNAEAAAAICDSQRKVLTAAANLERQLLDAAVRRDEQAAALSLDDDRVLALFKAHDPARIIRKAKAAKRIPMIAAWRCGRLLRWLGLSDSAADPIRRCAGLIGLATAEIDWRAACSENDSREDDASLMAGVDRADNGMRSASLALLDSTIRTAAFAGRRQLDALLNNRAVSDWGPKIAALPAARAWAVTAQSARAFPPRPGLFDLVVIDEASQCSIPAVLPLLYRAKRALIIGDPMQLNHIALVDPQSDAVARHTASITAAWLDRHDMSYPRHSAFHAAARAFGESMLLDEHFRCHPRIAEIANRLFYNGQLIVMTDVSSRVGRDDAAVNWRDVLGVAERGRRGSWRNLDEIRAVIELIDSLRESDDLPDTATIGVVTPFKPQALAIEELLGSDDRVKVGTVHTFQGGERDVMIFSLVATPDMPNGSIDWIDKQPNLWNVAITRARSQLHIIGDGRVWEGRRIGQELMSAAAGDADLTLPGSSEPLKRLHKWLTTQAHGQLEFGVRLFGHYTDAIDVRGRTAKAYILDQSAAADADAGRHLRLMLQRTRLRHSPRRGVDAARIPAWVLFAGQPVRGHADSKGS
ncbi:AAA domain-containing protein [Nocardia heshunensis]